MSTPAVNLYEMSMEELAQLSAGVALPPPEQPRDEKGRFTAVAPDPVADPVVDPVVDPPTDPAVPVDPPVDDTPVEAYTATIDLGDGSGVQVFEGATKDELLQKLITAQENATRKIRELTAKTTAAPVAPTPDPVLNPDEEAAFAQRLLSEPTTALEEFYRKRREEERKQEAEAQRQAEEAGRAEVQAANTFMAANPEYHKCDSNAHRINRVLQINGWETTTENLQKAYEELKTDGLLTAKPVAAAPPGPRSSGLSTRRSTPPTPPAPISKVRDAYKMSMEDLAALIRSGAQI